MKKKLHIYRIAELNFAMVLISTSGALGRYISLPPALSIFWRAILAAVFLFLFCKWKKINLFKSFGKDKWPILLGGILLGAHWVTYFYSLKLSNVAIGLLSLFTFPVLTSFLEPLLLKTKFQKVHLLLALLVLIGLYFLVPEFDLKNDYTIAVLLGVFSALCYALRNLVLKKQVQNYHGTALMWYQLIIVSVLLSPFLFLIETDLSTYQWPALIMLALFTTAVGHTLFLMSFKYFSVTTASIMSSAQPIYGILIGMIFLSEYPDISTIIGGGLILTSVIIESIRSFK
ncbi:EamA family transporter [Flavobacteriaceae bacterium R38]|nr:EamA family transporter [Flavobacteriaceae bacterium R38]